MSTRGTNESSGSGDEAPSIEYTASYFGGGGRHLYRSGSSAPAPPKIVTNHQAVLSSLYGLDSSKDLTLVAGTGVNGAEVKCHRIIFAAQSPVLSAMVSPDNGMLESQTGRVKMTGSSEAGLKLLVRYLYGLDISSQGLTCQVAVELFKTAHLYELTELQGGLQSFIVGKGGVHPLEWYTPDDLLGLYFHVKDIDGVVMEGFRDNLLRIMSRISVKLRACKGFKGLKKKEVEALLWKIVEVKGADPDEGRQLGTMRGRKRRRYDDDGSHYTYSW